MTTQIPRFVAAFLLAATAFLTVTSTFHVHAEDIKKNLCGGANLTLDEGGNDADGYSRSCTNPSDGSGNPKSTLNKLITDIINIFSTIVGIVAVIMIIVGGFKYVTSGGDSGKVGSAKNTIIYAIVGLIIVALAQSIVRFVLSKL